MTSTALPPQGAGAAEPRGPVATVAAMQALANDLTQTMWAARSGSELTGTVEALARLRGTLDAVDAMVVQELDLGVVGQAALKVAGWASVKDYLTHTSGGRRGAGPAMVKLSRHLDDYPALAEALADGRVSKVKAQIIAAAVTKLPGDVALREKAVAVLIEDAQRLSAEDLERAGRHVLEVVDPDGVDARLERELEKAERSAHLNRTLMMRFDRLGGGDGRFAGSREDLLLLKTALLALAAPQPAEPGACGGDGVCSDLICKHAGHDGRDLRDHGARMFDGLVQLARMAQATGALPDCHGGVPQVAVTMGLDDLRDQVGEATTTLGEDLDAATVRRMACDADLIPGVLGADGAILDVGRVQRLVSAAIWTVLVLRDKHCAFPGCRRPPVMCHAHHMTHWVDGGVTSLDNLVLLCGTHHRILHGTPWQVRLNPIDRRPEFKPPGGEVWVRSRHPAPPEDEGPPEGEGPPDHGPPEACPGDA